jgi:hypothetical protein
LLSGFSRVRANTSLQTDDVRDIACSLDWGLTLVEIVFAAITEMTVVPCKSAHYSEELVITALQRAVSR